MHKRRKNRVQLILRSKQFAQLRPKLCVLAINFGEESQQSQQRQQELWSGRGIERDAFRIRNDLRRTNRALDVAALLLANDLA